MTGNTHYYDYFLTPVFLMAPIALIGALFVVYGFVQNGTKIRNQPCKYYIVICTVFACLGTYWQNTGDIIFAVGISLLLMEIFTLFVAIVAFFRFKISTSFVMAFGCSLLLVPAIVSLVSACPISLVVLLLLR